MYQRNCAYHVSVDCDHSVGIYASIKLNGGVYAIDGGMFIFFHRNH